MSTSPQTPGSERPGLFVAFEGADGSGKSTQARAVAEALRARGRQVLLTREPGGSDLSEALRGLLLDPAHAPVDPRTEALLFAAARAAHVERTVRPALAAGTVVLTDRYVDSSIAYQGAVRGLGAERIAELNVWATQGLEPDLTVLLDVDAATAAGRRAGRHTGTGQGPDRMEQETAAAHETLRAAFRARAQAWPQRYLVLEAAAPAEALTEAVLTRLTALEREPGGQPRSGGGRA
ncbi:dTMP kinase [Micrococcus sp.]|uniref:dTMP kinase n=1 Tax=Micrococcus sp. TaxID=1271 RepID=UPI002A9150A0|nr:dTMP kinase [Micrococcus sp.]MDY6055184.1 dTMP kinase [Micrococcus sp.]